MSSTTGARAARPAGSGLTRADLRGRAAGVVTLAFFALGWTNWGVSYGVPDSAVGPVTTAAALGSAACVAGAVLLLRRAATAPPAGAGTRDRAVGRRFAAVVAVEVVGLLVIARVLSGTGRDELIPAAVCLGVGIHFFPLHRLFGVALYDRTGAALCLVALATAAIAPLTGSTVLWTLLPGLGAALALYGTCVLLVVGALDREADAVD